MKAIVITDHKGKILGAHRSVPIKHAKGELSFRPVINDRQKAHEIELEDDFFSHSVAHCRAELPKRLAAKASKA